MKGLLQSKMFWAAFIGLLVVLMQAYVPTFHLDGDELAGLIVVVAAYVVSLGVDPVTGWKDLLTSRRFYAAGIGIVVMVLEGFGVVAVVNTETVIGFAVVIGGYVVGLAFDPGNLSAKWASLLKSRKFWASAVGITMMILDACKVALPFELNQEQVISIAVLIGGYVAGVAFEGKYSNTLRRYQDEVQKMIDAASKE